MKSLLLAGLFLGVAFADNYPRQPGIDVQHYIFRVTLSDTTDEIAGETTVRVRLVQGGVRQMALDLAQPMTVDGVTAGGAAVRFERAQDRLLLPLDGPPGSLREFTIRYHGVPAGGLKIVQNRYGERCFSAPTGRIWRTSGSPQSIIRTIRRPAN